MEEIKEDIKKKTSMLMDEARGSRTRGQHGLHSMTLSQTKQSKTQKKLLSLRKKC
jgi:hypothetical protein